MVSPRLALPSMRATAPERTHGWRRSNDFSRPLANTKRTLIIYFLSMQRNGLIVRSFPWICNASIKDKETAMSKVCIIARVYGEFRARSLHHTVRKAKRLGLTGYAKILTMAAWKWLLAGEEGQVEKLMQWLKSGGPRSARVERVLSEPHHPSGELTDFLSVKYILPVLAGQQFWWLA
ncbi:acylphosphatase [Escherichia coli]